MILVTGGTGFIGATLIEQLLAAGHSVRAIKREFSNIPISLKNNSQLTWMEADLYNFFTLKDAFVGITKVYHCAALVSYDPKDQKVVMKTNAEGTAHIVNLCLENNVRLIHLSSVAALGEADNDEPISEKTGWEWNKKKSGYSISKYEAEREVWRGMAEGLDAVIVNPSVVIGAPRNNPKSGRIFKLIDKGLKFYPPGSIGIVDVEDVAKIMIMLMERTDISNENFILSAENVTYKALFAEYSALCGRNTPAIPAKKWLLSIAWRLHRLKSAIGLHNSGLTKEIARASLKRNKYTNDKIVKTLTFSFIPIKQSLAKICV